MTKRILKLSFIFLTLIIFFFIFLISKRAVNLLAGRINLVNFNKTDYKQQAYKFNFTPNPIAKDKNGYTTILLVGVDTRAHTHLFNTDTIMTLTYSWKDHKAFLISYPRDLYVKYPDTYYHFKINAVASYGKRVFNQEPLTYLEKAITQISGLTIQYHVLIDFKGFTDLVNQLGGVKIYIPRAFTDHMYPTERGGWQTIKFTKGWHTLNGDLALKYARSRHALGPEGSDFARAKRQQLIIKAIMNQTKDKIKKDPAWAFRTFQKLISYVQASKISPNELKAGLNVFLKKGMPKIYSIVLTPATAKGTLLMSQANPLYIIVPRAGIDNWQSIKNYIQLYLKYPETITKEPTISIAYTNPNKLATALTIYNKLKNTFYWLYIYYPKLNTNKLDTNIIKYKSGFKGSAEEINNLLKLNAKLLEDKTQKSSISIYIK